uniref:Uncharacterized protein n=1 Tax=Arundo donax TaxID=35708 RepID=A0A0A9GNS0_ARUDO
MPATFVVIYALGHMLHKHSEKKYAVNKQLKRICPLCFLFTK